MICPKCNAPNHIIEVKNTYSKYIEFNHRVLACKNCGYRYDSFEKVDIKTMTAPSAEIAELFPNKVYKKIDMYLSFKDKNKNDNRKAS